MIAHRKAIKLLQKAGYFLKRHGFDEDDLRYIEKEIELGERR